VQSKQKNSKLYPGQELKALSEANKERFLAIMPESEDLGGLLECILQAAQARAGGYSTAILVHEGMQELARESGVFDRIHLQNNGRISLRLKKFKADVIFLSDSKIKNQVKLLFSGSRVKIAAGKTAFARFFPAYDIHNALDRTTLTGIFKTSAKKFKISMELADPPRRAQEPYVYLSLFDRHDSDNFWPVSYVPRLARLLGSRNLKLMVHIPGHAKREDVVFLRRNASELLLLDDLSAIERARHIQHAALFIGSPGPETALAGMLGCPIIFLSDMKAIRRQTEDDLQSIARRIEAIQKQLVPVVEECINNCAACAYSSCLEYISPELVFSMVGELARDLNGHARPGLSVTRIDQAGSELRSQKIPSLKP
jgi:ADP-heptose:LPS heptosyltransferase